jgi:prepilin-type N-terminal cleavage/methylation domain-containing protein
MLALKRRPQASVHNRIGFTLIELLIVLVIIAILAALILPAVMRGTNTVRIAEVNNEMAKFKTAITQFKVDFGVEPPSSLTIWERATDWASHPRDRRIVKQLWPQFDFSLDREFDGDALGLPGYQTEDFPMDGAECLVFFLGGMADRTTGALRGFSSNARNPFVVDNGARVGPFFEFKGGFDVSGSTPAPTGRFVDTDSDGLPEYLDTLPGQTLPYLYFSSYGGEGYKTGDNLTRIAAPYFKDALSRVPHKESSFQLISPGFDFNYGTGGQFDPDNPPSNTNAPDSDNITNFHSGVLGG